MIYIFGLPNGNGDAPWQTASLPEKKDALFQSVAVAQSEAAIYFPGHPNSSMPQGQRPASGIYAPLQGRVANDSASADLT